MNFSYYIAKRHLLGHHKIGFISFISIFSVIGLSVGVAALILTVSILNGFEKELKSKLVDFDSHIRLNMMNFSSLDSAIAVEKKIWHINQDYPFNNFLDSNFKCLLYLNQMRNIPLTPFSYLSYFIPNIDIIKINQPIIKSIVPYIQRSVIIRNKNLTDGVFVEGLDQEQLGNTINIKRFLVEGEVAFQTKEGKDGILMGQKLARKLELELGDKVYLFVIRGDNHIGSRPKIGTFILTGIYDSGVSDYDDIFVYSSLEAVRKLFRAPQSLSGFQIMLHNPEKADEIASLIDEKLGFPYNARSMNDMHANLFEWLRVQRLPVILIFGLISLVAVFNIVSSLMMIVIEKTKDIGILKSYGVNNLQIMRIFVLESLFIGLAGVGIGFLLTLLLSWLQNNFGLISIPEDVYFMHELPILLDVKNFIYVGVGALFFSLTATVYPAYKATQLEPVEAIRYE